MPIGQQLQESDILIESIAGLKRIIGTVAVDYGEPPLPVAEVPSSWSQRDIFRQFNKVGFPYLAMTLQRFSENTEGYNKNLRRVGFWVPNSNSESNSVTVFRLIPVVTNWRIRYYSLSSAEVMRFSSRWLLRQKDTQFWLENSGAKFRIQVKVNTDLSIPEQESNDWGTTFTLETDATMYTYTGEIETRTKITKVVLTPNVWSTNAKKSIIIEPQRTIAVNYKPSID